MDRAACDALLARIDEQLAWDHLEYDDCWYSCPKSGHCCDPNAGATCGCGKDARDALSQAVRAALVELADEAWR